MGDLWTLTQAVKELRVSMAQARSVAQQHLGQGVMRVGNYLVADADWWRAHVVPGRRWLRPDEIERIKQLAESGLRPVEIASQVGCSVETVWKHLKKLGLPSSVRRRQDRIRALREALDRVGGMLPEPYRRAAEMRIAGKTLVQVGEAMGVTHQRVHQMEQEILEIAHEAVGGLEQLPRRVRRALIRAGLDSREKVESAFASGRLRLVEGIGPAGFVSIYRWLKGDGSA